MALTLCIAGILVLEEIGRAASPIAYGQSHQSHGDAQAIPRYSAACTNSYGAFTIETTALTVAGPMREWSYQHYRPRW